MTKKEYDNSYPKKYKKKFFIESVIEFMNDVAHISEKGGTIYKIDDCYLNLYKELKIKAFMKIQKIIPGSNITINEIKGKIFPIVCKQYVLEWNS